MRDAESEMRSGARAFHSIFAPWREQGSDLNHEPEAKARVIGFENGRGRRLRRLSRFLFTLTKNPSPAGHPTRK
jgi:hypothetical protein